MLFDPLLTSDQDIALLKNNIGKWLSKLTKLNCAKELLEVLEFKLVLHAWFKFLADNKFCRLFLTGK